jgi:hypothetical protein
MKRVKRAPFAALAMVALCPGEARAQTGADEKVDRLISLLVSDGIISPEKARALRAATDASAQDSAAPGKPQDIDNQSAMRPPERPNVPPALASSSAAPILYRFPHNQDPSIDPSAPVVRSAGFAARDTPWTDRIQIDGDIRLRWQAEYFTRGTSAQNPNWAAIAASTLANAIPTITTTDRARLRYRGRFGVTARIDDHFTAVIRLAAGNLTDPTSTDQTLGNFFNRNPVGIDRAYLQWAPNANVTVMGGHMPNPFFTTNLLFDSDVNPEGVAASVRLPLKTGYLYATGSVWYVQENAGPTPDRFTYAAQVGASGLPLTKSTHLKLAATYYDWSHYQAQIGNAATISTVLGTGNTVMNIDPRAGYVLPGVASPFRIVEGLGAVSQRVGKRYALSAAFDVAVNIAYDPAVLARLPLLSVPNGNVAWLAALTFGDPNVAHWRQWQVTASMRRLQSDSVIAAFTEGDFTPGGTNRAVDALEGLIGLDRNAWLQLNYVHNRFLTGPRFEYNGIRTQLNVRF